jgi:hypothetical protein
MHRNLFLLLIPAAFACQSEAPPRGPTATTLAIMETEPEAADPSTPVLATVFGEARSSVERDAHELAFGDTEVLEPMELPRHVAVEVRSGENLVLLARWAGTSVEVVAELNGLDVTDPLYPGQSLLLPTADEAADASLVTTREAFAQARLERYLERRGGLMALEEHRVRTGETAWAIARDQLGIPTWVLAAYNPGSDLEHLGIGERLMVPVLSDTVAELEQAVERVEPDEVQPWELGPEPTVFDEVDLPSELDLPSIDETVSLGEEDPA